MTKLRLFQREGIDRIHQMNGRCLLADEFGLGKTIQILSYLKESKHWPAIIVCPAPLKLEWQNQAWEHTRLVCHLLYGERPSGMDKRTAYEAAVNEHRLLIINYDILRHWTKFLKLQIKPQFVGLDEAHAVGNIAAQRTQLTRILCKDVPHVIVATGTPITNRPWELYPLLNILDPVTYNSPFTFGTRYCESDKQWGRWKFSGARQLRKLHRSIKPLMIRRLKRDVLTQLPPLEWNVVPVEISNSREYQKAEKDLIGWLMQYDKVAAFKAKAERRVRFIHLKKLAAQLKLQSVKAWVDSFLEESESKLLIGAWHVRKPPVLPEIYGWHQEISRMVHGGMGSKQREKNVESFKKDPKVRILAGQIKAMGQGHNIPEAQDVMLAELPWTPGACLQFINRAHRLTSTGSVRAWFLVAAGTIEETICKIIQQKAGILDQVLDGVAVKEDSLTMFDALHRKLVKKGKRGN